MSFTAERAFFLVESAHRRRRLAHALLLTGPPGSGKERLAARIIRLVGGSGAGSTGLWGEADGGEPPPLDELADARTRIVRPAMRSRAISIGTIRELERELNMATGPGQWKIGVIVEADRLGDAAENAFLKTLEEPPGQTLILLLTALPEALLPTIRSRCVHFPLTASGIAVDAHGEKLLAVLRALGAEAIGRPRGALVLQAAVARVLAEAREEIDAAAARAFKAEVERYGQGSEGKWLDRREDEHEAIARSDYLRTRQALLDLLAAWLGDVLRQKAGGGGLDFPAEAGVTGRLAEGRGWPELLRRVEAFEDVQRGLETNAQEQLVLEVGFLRAFG